MATPSIQLIPLRAAVSTERESTLDVLVRIIAPTVDRPTTRPSLNLSLVIDRSGSMDGDKIAFARQAAAFAVEQLLPQDRVSVVIFDDEVQTLVPSTLVENRQMILEAIRRIQAGGSTALHEAWRQGGLQVSHHLDREHLNRVILLSDGLANVGETNPDVIATDVHKLAGLGVSTTTMGVGDDYNEDLMAAMAKSGDGNYYRQLTFYKLLLARAAQPREVSEGVIEFVEPDEAGKVRSEAFEIPDADVQELESLIQKSAQEILSLSFWNTPCSEKDCRWCSYRFGLATSR